MSKNIFLNLAADLRPVLVDLLVTAVLYCKITLTSTVIYCGNRRRTSGYQVKEEEFMTYYLFVSQADVSDAFKKPSNVMVMRLITSSLTKIIQFESLTSILGGQLPRRPTS